MALSPQTLQGIKNLLLSERITYKGSEIPALNSILNDLALTEMEMNQARAKPKLVPPPENPPQEGTGEG